MIYGSTCLQRMKALQELGNIVTPICTFDPRLSKLFFRAVMMAKRKIFGRMWDIANANRDLIARVKDFHPEIVWIDKGLTIRKETLVELRRISTGVFLISYSPDDMLNPHNQSGEYLDCLPEYDLHVTTKSYNYAELKELGAREVLLIKNGFSESLHRPVEVTEKTRVRLGGKIGFIGYYERQREQTMKFLARHGLSVRVWGPWGISRHYPPNMLVEGESLWGEEYVSALCAFDINLCFLRKVNRDLQTTRSMEIPACGAFMLGERTPEHLELFNEGKEAEFFGSDEELLEKARYYLAHEPERRRIAEAGRQRCLASGYGNRTQLQLVLAHVERRTKRP